MNTNYVVRLLREELEKPGSLEWYEWSAMKQDCLSILDLGSRGRRSAEVELLLHHFYRQYVYAEDAYWEGDRMKCMFIETMFCSDAHILSWLDEELDLLRMTEQWAKRDNAGGFKDVLCPLLRVGYVDFPSEVRARVDEYLQGMEVEGARRGGVDMGAHYCMLHAYLVIASAELPHERKEALLKLFFEKWSFLRYVYCVVFRCIVGCRLTNFVSVANNVAYQSEYEPYLHLFYAPLKEQFEALCQRGTKPDKLMNSVRRLEEKMENVAPSDELDELCGMLFSEEYRCMLERHRRPSYGELRQEVESMRIKSTEMEETVRTLKAQAQDMAERLSDLLNKSVPLSEIENELMKFPSTMAWPIYVQLNTLLAGNALWLANTSRIRDSILAKQQKEMKLNMNVTAQPGSHVNALVQQQTNNGTIPEIQLVS